MDDLGLGFGVGIQKGFWKRDLAYGVPLEFISMDLTIEGFEVINFAGFGGSPKIGLGVRTMGLQPFQPFADQKILPQRAGFGTRGQQGIVAEDGVSDAVVVEKNLAGFGQFVAEVAAERGQTEHDERFFEHIEISYRPLKPLPCMSEQCSFLTHSL